MHLYGVGRSFPCGILSLWFFLALPAVESFQVQRSRFVLLHDKVPALKVASKFKRLLSVGVSIVIASLPTFSEEMVQSRDIDYSCLVGKCGGSLLSSFKNLNAFGELMCLGRCGKEDIGCLSRCGNLYENEYLKDFNSCALSHGCIPQYRDKSLRNPIDTSLLPEKFDPSLYTGFWYVTHGLNPIFDCYDCQRHSVSIDESGSMVVDISYKVSSPSKEGDFVRKLRHRFKQDDRDPSVLKASDDSYLKQEDSWYILDGNPEKHMLIYYTGCNSAWCGYSGGIVYSRFPELDGQSKVEIEKAAERFGIRFEEMCPIKVTECSLANRLSE